MIAFRMVIFVLFFGWFVYKSSAGWANNQCPPNQFGFNGGNKNVKTSDPSRDYLHNYLANQGLKPANNGIIRVNNCDKTVRFQDRNGNTTQGSLNSKGQFVPNNNNNNNINNNKNINNNSNNINNDLSNDELQFAKMQYKMLCNSDMEDIALSLKSIDFKVLAGACVAAAEFNLDVNDALFDLLTNDKNIVSQSARKALTIQSFYLLSKIKRVQGNNNDYFKGKPTPDNLLKFTNGKNLEIGKDYVDFGPLPNDDNVGINSSINRWQFWFKRNELKLSNMINDPSKSLK